MSFGNKNILLLIPTFTEGGAQKMVYEIGRILAERYNVYECSYDAFGEPHVFRNENIVLSLESPHSGSLLKKITDYPQKISRLRKIKKKYKIDVTISNLWSADLVNILSGTSDKTISIGHISILGNFQNRLLLKYRKLGKLIYGRFDKIIAVNEALMHELREVFEIPSSKIDFINNFIAFPKELPSHAARQDNKKRLVNVGRLNPIKNQEPLLRIFKNLKSQFPGLQLIFIGNGPLEEQLKGKAQELNLRISSSFSDSEADVIFTGFVDPYKFMGGCDMFVFPSKSEGLPLVMVEAMYAELPMVTSDCPTGGPHVVMEGKGTFKLDRTDVEETKYGYLMPIPDEENESTLKAWQQIITELLVNENKRLQMGKEAKQRSLDFSVDKIKDQYFKAIEEILK
ncbi:glycosyltransferase [Rufibacter roseus]|uniref:Glycosyltransferase n=1 Tax=Rufibacter roseus TaxID=1567108 RepID=A0ABW2DND7_9BACT|nr:glycosyltransferase [Rufibacter roseus]